MLELPKPKDIVFYLCNDRTIKQATVIMVLERKDVQLLHLSDGKNVLPSILFPTKMEVVTDLLERSFPTQE